MNQDPATQWSPMVTGPEDEFASFLNFGDLSFPEFDGISQNNADLQPQNGAVHLDSSIDEGSGQALRQEHSSLPHQQSHVGLQSRSTSLNGYGDSNEPFSELPLQPEIFEEQQAHMRLQHERYRTQNVIPPTPNSMSMQGTNAHYYRAPIDQQQLHLYDQYRRQKEQMIFTPLVSPAVTPLDTQFQYPDFSAPPDGTFSPLASPALRAQQNVIQHPVYGPVLNSDTSNTTSPVDHNLENPVQTSASKTVVQKKPRRKPSSASNPNRAVKHSPAMKPQRKKHSSSTIIPPKDLSGILEEARASKHNASGSQSKLLPYGQDSSGADSVSPEPLSEVLMPPPATPKSGSSGRSPNIEAKQKSSSSSLQTSIMNGEPATPASLMKIRKQNGKGLDTDMRASTLKEQTAAAEADMEQIMEDITLPEPTASPKRPALEPINTAHAALELSSSKTSARETPKAGPASAPITSNVSALPSPQIAEFASPGGSASSKRGDPKPQRGRESKKRNSHGSVQVSPALRPKISPSIKPLLHENGVISADTSALLLASKSNYQNILEGTHLPGVSYPETLSTNLTSKRTSHKIAEQGRRNRINTALQEIASLLPKTPALEINGSTGNGAVSGSTMMSGTAVQQSNSKASTVELAIEYIKTLQKELEETKSRLEILEREKPDQRGTT